MSLLRPQDLVLFLQLHPAIQAVSSHTLPPPKPDVPDFAFWDCLLVRHPLDRLLSMYDFYRRSDIATDPLSAEAKRLGLGQFFGVLIQSYPQMVNNGQVNYLNGGRKISREPGLQRAFKMVKQGSIVGVTERFDECMVTAEQVLKAHFGPLDFSYVPQNVSPGRMPDLASRLQHIRKACGDELYERLLKLNRLDLELLEAATTEARQRFAQLSDGQKLMTNFLDRCRKRTQHTTAVAPAIPNTLLPY